MVVLERYLGVGKGDATIAATAIERNEPVLAGDSHFKSIPGVEVAVLLLRVRLFTVLNVASCRSARPSRTDRRVQSIASHDGEYGSHTVEEADWSRVETSRRLLITPQPAAALS